MQLIEDTCVVPPASTDLEATRRALAAGGLFGGARGAAAARHLGLEVGVGAEVVPWNSVRPEVARRALNVRAATQSVGARICLHNSHVALMLLLLLLHRGRFADVGPSMILQMRHTAQYLTKAQ